VDKRKVEYWKKYSLNYFSLFNNFGIQKRMSMHHTSYLLFTAEVPLGYRFTYETTTTKQRRTQIALCVLGPNTVLTTKGREDSRKTGET